MSFVDGNGDASRILSKECYDKWVATRRSKLKQPQESFRRVLTAHVCGLDGRRPFPVDVEKSLLKALRKREIWECFRDTGVSIGIRGFRNVGYHERNGQQEKPRKRSFEEFEEKDVEQEEKVKELKTTKKAGNIQEILPLADFGKSLPIMAPMPFSFNLQQSNQNTLNMLQELHNMASIQALAGIMSMANAPLFNSTDHLKVKAPVESVSESKKDIASTDLLSEIEKWKALTLENLRRANEMLLSGPGGGIAQESPFQFMQPPSQLFGGGLGR